MKETRAGGDGIAVRPGGDLVDRVHALLRRGAADTATVARQVLGLSGNAGAAAHAVWTLLGSDDRFVVDATGVWSLRTSPSPAPAAACSLREEEWVVVDVETTGGTPTRGHRVTEIAAVWVAGGEIRETYSSLVNPHRPIPGMIAELTGITDRMVRDAPSFHEVAPRVAEMLRGRVFVAHNAPFDWRFLTAEMERTAGLALSGRQLCTVRLARKLLPQLPSRSLDSLARYFNLDIASRHRATDDAVATARLLLHFLDMLEDRGLAEWSGVETLLARRAARRKRSASPRSMDSA